MTKYSHNQSHETFPEHKNAKKLTWLPIFDQYFRQTETNRQLNDLNIAIKNKF